MAGYWSTGSRVSPMPPMMNITIDRTMESTGWERKKLFFIFFGLFCCGDWVHFHAVGELVVSFDHYVLTLCQSAFYDGVVANLRACLNEPFFHYAVGAHYEDESSSLLDNQGLCWHFDGVFTDIEEDLHLCKFTG